MTSDNYHLDTAYIAGLFDGEGSLTYKKYKEKKKWCLQLLAYQYGDSYDGSKRYRTCA